MTRSGPMPTRAAIEAASAWLRRGRVPPQTEAERIANALDGVALALTLGDVHVRRFDKQQSQEA